MEKNQESKSWFVEKISKLDKLLAKFTKKYINKTPVPNQE